MKKHNQMYIRGRPVDTTNAENEIKKYLEGDDNNGSRTIGLDYSPFINSMIIGEFIIHIKIKLWFTFMIKENKDRILKRLKRHTKFD